MYHRHTAAAYSLQVAFLGVLLSVAPTEQLRADSSPYQAKVIASGAPIHSGPGDNFYPTDTLSQGDTVEVYREKTGGWLAIRPPMGSFSWVSAQDLEIKDGDLAEVASDEVASRIGSRLSERRNAAQVRLKRGETVEVLGDETIGGEKWYKIAPPAGEFRWIQAAVVQREAATKDAETLPTKVQDNLVQLAAGTEAVPAGAASAGDAAPPPLLPVAKPAHDIPAPAAPADTGPTPTATAPAPAAPAAPNAQNAPAAAAPQPAAQASGDLSRELAAIELRLSRMVAAPVNLWNTARLELDASALMARAQTQPERDALRVTQEKINRFAGIARRANPGAATVAQSPLPQTAAAPGGVAATTPTGPYDAEGILRPVVSRRPGAPQYALVDERGQVLSFVTSTPDLNLQPYLGHRVGVVGIRGYIAEFQRANVTAARVTPLNDRMVR